LSVIRELFPVIGCLKEPSLRGLQPGSPQFFAVQRKLILHRSLLKRHYDDWNRRLLGLTERRPRHAIAFDGCCGRTDLPGGDAAALYESLTQKLAIVPDDAILYPGHQYSPASAAPNTEAC
jgi:hypothetical protein